MKADASLAWATDAISAQHISAKMLAPCRTSLNEIAVQSTLALLRGLQQRGMNIVAVRSTLMHTAAHTPGVCQRRHDPTTCSAGTC